MFDTSSTLTHAHTHTHTPSVQTHQSCVGASMVVHLFVFIHPDLSGSHAVCQSFAPWVRGLFREHMTHMGAGVDLQAAPTLPNLRDINNTTGTRRIWLASRPWFNHSIVLHKAQPCYGGVGKQKSCFVVDAKYFWVLPLRTFGFRGKGSSNSSL